jgi:hypothetical protein
MTAPKTSDYYRVIAKNPFSTCAYSEYVQTLYSSKGYSVQVIKQPFRFYVDHAQKSNQEAIVLWRFFHDTSRMPSRVELCGFKKRLLSVQDSKGYINFKDELLVVTQGSRADEFPN